MKTVCSIPESRPNFFLAALGSSLGVCGLSLVGYTNCPTVSGIFVPGPGTELTIPALEGGFFTTGPPEKSLKA